MCARIKTLNSYLIVGNFSGVFVGQIFDVMVVQHQVACGTRQVPKYIDLWHLQRSLVSPQHHGHVQSGQFLQDHLEPLIGKTNWSVNECSNTQDPCTVAVMLKRMYIHTCTPL